MYRAYIAQKKYGVVLDEIRPSASQEELVSVRLLADFLANESKRYYLTKSNSENLTFSFIYFSDNILRDLDSKMGGNVKNSFCLLVTGYMYYLSEVIHTKIISFHMLFYFFLEL